NRLNIMRPPFHFQVINRRSKTAAPVQYIMFTLPTALRWITINSLFLFPAVLFPAFQFYCQMYFCNRRCSLYIPDPQYTAPFQQNGNMAYPLNREQLYLFADSHAQYFHVPLVPSGASAY